MAQRDAALDAFDGLRIREVAARYHDTAATFLAKFQSTAAELESDERTKLEVVYSHESGVELLKTVLFDPQANKICALHWVHLVEDDVNFVIPLLLSNCPELVLLQVDFDHHSVFDFVSSVLEHPSNKIKVLQMLDYTKGSIPRFFAALAQSQVLALTLCGDGTPEFAQGLCEYLTKDLLVRLEVSMNWKQVPSEVMMSLAICTRLAKLKMYQCEFAQPTAFAYFPKRITKLKLERCAFVGDVDWSFLVGGSVRELHLCGVKGVDGIQLGRALAVHLREKGLDKLRFFNCDFVNEVLVAAGVEIGQIKRLEFDYTCLNDASVELIALVLQSPSSEMRELAVLYENGAASSIVNHLVPAFKHPNCNLAKLKLWAYQDKHNAVGRRVESELCSRRALFLLLQGQQVRRLYCPLRRLPVEMFRMVGEVLL